MVQGADWYEDLASIYFTSGLLDDFFGRITGNFDGGEKVSASISSDAGSEDIVELLADGIAKDPRLGLTTGGLGSATCRGHTADGALRACRTRSTRPPAKRGSSRC